MPPLCLLIKPASGSCNMRCRYCFYTDETENRSVALRGVMSRETMETIVDKALSYADGACTFSFQGGEPTLAGLPFFRHFTAVASKREDITVSFAFVGSLKYNVLHFSTAQRFR